MPFVNINIVMGIRSAALCSKPYYNHPKGCPNLGKKDGCPPIKTIDQLISFDNAYAIYNKFDFKRHTDNMRNLHPEWSDRQVECCLYWQGKARKQLKGEIALFKFKYPEYEIINTPEACGVNVTATMKNTGIILEWPPVNFTYQVVIGGRPHCGKRGKDE